MKEIKNFFKEAYEVFKKPAVRILPGNLAYFMVFSIFPILMIILYIGSSFNLSNMVDLLGGMIPQSVLVAIKDILSNDSFTIANGLSLIMAFYIISNGANSIIITSNTLYGINNQPFLTRRIKAFLLTIVLILLFFFTIVVIGFGNYIIKIIIEVGEFGESLYYPTIILKWLLSLFLMYFMIKVIYTIAPDKQIPSKYMSKGALFTALFWLMTTEIYAIYVSAVDYTKIYGSLSSIIILTIWIYLLAFVMVLGIGMNVKSYQETLENTNKIVKKRKNNKGTDYKIS